MQAPNMGSLIPVKWCKQAKTGTYQRKCQATLTINGVHYNNTL